MSRKLALAILCTVVALSTFTSPAFAQHFTKRGAPSCTDTGTQLVCRGELAGLGNENLVIEVTSDAEATFLCGAPGSGKPAAGQNKVPFEAGGSQTISGGAIKNGRAVFSVTAPTEPPTATAEQAGCPNPNWQVIRVEDVDFADVVLTIEQGSELLFTCTYAGEVPEGQAVALDCT